jgi:glutamate dehydrogenase (NAD(P)+)
MGAHVPILHAITEQSRLLGYIAIDSTVAGRSRGGLRLVPDLSPEEISAAATSMTLKYGLLGLPQGGAKAGLFGDPDASPVERRLKLSAFAAAAATLLRTHQYVPDADLGTTAAEVREMMLAVGARVGPREWRANHSGEHTARSCLATARALLERSGTGLNGCRVAIEGFGKVGAPLARLLAARGATVVAISTSRGAIYRPDGLDVLRLVDRAATVGSCVVDEEPGRMDRERLLELPVDLLCPCARYHSIHAGNAERIAATTIAAGANDPVSPDAARRLEARGVRYVPAFVSNCGGVLGGTLEFAGVTLPRIATLIEDAVRRLVLGLLERAERAGVSPGQLATSEALARHAAVRARAEHPGLTGRLAAAGLAAYHRGWMPASLVAPVATRKLLRGLL